MALALKAKDAKSDNKNRGLGRGLSALIAESKQGSEEGQKALGLDSLVPGKYQPRSNFDDEKLQELAESIKRNGIIQPIIVRPVKNKINTYEIIAGERRWRAAKMAGLSEAPVIIRDIADRDVMELALVENIQRQDLSPLEEAEGYQRLIREFSYTQEELAGTVGKSRSHIANLMRLLALPDEIKDLLTGGSLSMGHARALLNVENAVEIAKEVVAKDLSVRQTEKLAQGANGGAAARNGGAGRGGHHAPQMGSRDEDILALEEMLTRKLGARVGIISRGKKGEITISYETLEQLDLILRKLGGA